MMDTLIITPNLEQQTITVQLQEHTIALTLSEARQLQQELKDALMGLGGKGTLIEYKEPYKSITVSSTKDDSVNYSFDIVMKNE